MNANGKRFRLIRRNGRVAVKFECCGREVPVRVVWARPISGRGKDVAFIDDKKKTVAMADGVDELDATSREIAEEEIDRRYLMTRISKVWRTRTHFGVRFWDVETDRGRRSFAVKDPNRSVFALDDDRMVIRDTLGNSYEILALSELDRRSQELIENVV